MDELQDLKGHPLNKRATALLKQEKEAPWPEMLPILQLLIHQLGPVLPDPLTAQLLDLNPRTVMKQVKPILKAADLEDATAYAAAILIAEAVGVDVTELDL